MQFNYVVLQSRTAKSQQGIVLIVGLVMMLLLTIVGLAAIRGSGLQENMAFNMRDRNVAFQAAESGLRKCEGDLSRDNKTIPVPTCLDKQGMCRDLNATPATTASNGGDYLNQKAKDTQLGVVGVASQPICLIEMIDVDPTACAATAGAAIGVKGGIVSCPQPYRVTSQAVGAEVTSQSLIQSIYTRRF